MGKETVVRIDGARFIGPGEFAVLQEAVKQARWILSSNGVGDDDELRLILAKGVMTAARRGERELYDLTLSACRHWFSSFVPKRPAHLRSVDLGSRGGARPPGWLVDVCVTPVTKTQTEG